MSLSNLVLLEVVEVKRKNFKPFGEKLVSSGGFFNEY